VTPVTSLTGGAPYSDRGKAGPSVNTTILLQKLIDIEKSIGNETNRAILDKIFDAENCVLDMQRELIESLRREPRLAAIQRLALAILAA
jgi:hypothetical protein